MAKIVRGHSLEHRGGGLSKVEFVGDLDQSIGRDSGILSVTAERAGIGDTVADFNVAGISARCDHDTRGFLSINERQRCGIATFAKINIDKVHAGSFDLHDRFVWFGFRDGKFDEFKNFGTTGLRNLYGFHVGNSKW